MLTAERGKVPDLPAQDPCQALARLRREFADCGWERKATARILAQLAVHVTCMLTGTALFLAGPAGWIRAAALVVAALGCIGIATNTHTSSHYATSSRRWVNQALTFFGYPFCLGFSALYWWSDHVGGHHISPNVQGLDNDFDYWPFFAITQPEVLAAKGWARRYYERWQWLALILLAPMLGFNLQRCGLRYLLGAWRDARVRKGRILVDVCALILHWSLFLALPAYYFGLPAVLAMYAARIALTSAGMFTLLAPAHFVAGAPILTQAEAAGLDYCALQTMTTIDFAGGPLVRWLASGLDYQIEHHLFPEISHVRYPRISGRVEAFCASYSLPYRRYSFIRALRETLRVFRQPKPVRGLT